MTHRGITAMLVAGVLVAGGTVTAATTTAGATGTLSVIPATGLTQRQIVRVTGSGLAPGARGFVLECNRTLGEPTVLVGSPFHQSFPVGCSPPSLKQIVAVTAGGQLSTTFQVRMTAKLGPPCGIIQVLGSCGHVDSRGRHPRSDAHAFPCPPTPAQKASGAICALVFYDTSNEVVVAPIAF